MEIALCIRNFSYYSTSETVYISGTVFKKLDFESQSPVDNQFNEVKKNSKINLKLASADPETIRILTSERIVKIRSEEILKPTEPSRCITFIAKSVKSCEL